MVIRVQQWLEFDSQKLINGKDYVTDGCISVYKKLKTV